MTTVRIGSPVIILTRFPSSKYTQLNLGPEIIWPERGEGDITRDTETESVAVAVAVAVVVVVVVVVLNISCGWQNDICM
ncbi:hypothetical protein ElyMa_001297900 [Elysia marginata]|uniref:Uncharacterized protein n=1 Tax=Elysia marginata TaxID=1093978 RepID=A0AAV4IE93_9GAST|nr:hypothetical protein ElyMa_001297900 [Elysia marginata]